jgi:hypothetical protein
LIFLHVTTHLSHSRSTSLTLYWSSLRLISRINSATTVSTTSATETFSDQRQLRDRRSTAWLLISWPLCSDQPGAIIAITSHGCASHRRSRRPSSSTAHHNPTPACRRPSSTTCCGSVRQHRPQLDIPRIPRRHGIPRECHNKPRKKGVDRSTTSTYKTLTGRLRVVYITMT